MHKEQLLNNKNYGALQAIYYLFMVYPNSRFIRNLGWNGWHMTEKYERKA
jgi:hypothetical protein